jgi:leucyl-tRNA synthetase
MQESYNPHEIEARWQAMWYRTGIYEPDIQHAPKPYYNLMMFPYPSAAGLHIGNLFAFVGADIHGRFMAMNGYDLFEPIGFDAFGIHSENYAIKQGINPRILTARNVERFRETQLKVSGNRYDWSHEVDTTDPRYYRWTQWMFVKLFKAGLAERKRAAVNWCPSCKTVLADEQVIGGLCERCDTPVEQRDLEQWFFKITNYAQRLLDNLDHIDWSEVVKTAQRNWIGRSEGLRFRLPVEGRTDVEIPVFTTRPDTIFGMTYVVLAPEHPLVDQLTVGDRRAAVEAYREQVRLISKQERLAGSRGKSGEFIGAYAINPINQERVPIWVADYVLMGYGTGAIMAVPAHDERDYAFAQAFGLPIRQVVVPHHQEREPELIQAYTEPGLVVDSGPFSGSSSAQAAQNIIAWFKANSLGEGTVQYRLRDWLISRQRYWGPPIPIVYCDACGTLPVPEDQLPVLLPDVEDWKPTGTGSSPLAAIPSFVKTTCPECGGAARRETDVSDNFLDSAWYFLRYPSTEFDDRPFDAELTAKWLPVDMYIGGREHSVLHLMYTRFVTMALHDLGYLPFDEPFKQFRAHGTITKDGAKISKSRGNIVNPDEYIATWGADTIRMYLMFMGPYTQGGDFSDRGISGVRRFLNRVWNLVVKHADRLNIEAAPAAYRRRLHQTIQRVTEDIRELGYNTAIAALMEYVNNIQQRDELYVEEVEGLLLLLAPFTPHIAEELWERIGRPYSIHQQAWPVAAAALLVRETETIAIQINGRVRGTVELPTGAAQDEAVEAAHHVEAVQRYLNGSPIQRVVYVPGRIINLIIGG